MPRTDAIGEPVWCSDGACGELSRIIVDLAVPSVTHLVVEPHHEHARGRVVPVVLAEARGDGILLSCTLAPFGDLDHAEEVELLPAEPWMLPPGYPPAGLLAWPSYEARPAAITHESVPLGEVEIRRGEHVHAADGPIGKVRGLGILPREQHVTHVLLHEGHLSNSKDVAVPIGALDRIDEDGVHVSLTRREVRALPEVPLTR